VGGNDPFTYTAQGLRVGTITCPHFLRVTDYTPQLPSFPSFRYPRHSRKALHCWFCPSASGGHDLALCLGALKRVLAPPVDECLLCCWAGLGVHPTFGDLPPIPEFIIIPRPSCPVDMVANWGIDLCVGCGVWDAVGDTVCNAVVPLILEFTVLLLRDVDDCRGVVEQRPG